MTHYTLDDARALHEMKNRLRELTRLLDATGTKVYPDTLEARAVKHELSTLLAECQFHGLLPTDVSLSSSSARVGLKTSPGHVQQKREVRREQP